MANNVTWIRVINTINRKISYKIFYNNWRTGLKNKKRIGIQDPTGMGYTHTNDNLFRTLNAHEFPWIIAYIKLFKHDWYRIRRKSDLHQLQTDIEEKDNTRQKPASPYLYSAAAFKVLQKKSFFICKNNFNF